MVTLASNKSNLFNESKKTANATLSKDKGFINTNSESTISAKQSGTVVLNSGIYAQYKCDKVSGVATEYSLQSITNTVQKELNTSDLIINRHKFNTQLLEFTNMKVNMNTVMGDLTVNATILVKAWEPDLEQYVLIRRPARFAVFGNLLDAYVVDERLDIEGDFSEDLVEYKRTLNDLTPPDDSTENNEETDTSDGIM